MVAPFGEEMESEDDEENEENHQDGSDENEVEDDDDDDGDDDGDDDDEKSKVFSNFEKKQEKVACQLKIILNFLNETFVTEKVTWLTITDGVHGNLKCLVTPGLILNSLFDYQAYTRHIGRRV